MPSFLRMRRERFPDLRNLKHDCPGRDVFSNDELLAHILKDLYASKKQKDFCSWSSLARGPHATASTSKEFAAAVNLLKGPTEEEAIEFLESIGITLPLIDTEKTVPWGYADYRTCAADVCLTLSNLRLREDSCSDRPIETMKAEGLTSLNIKAGLHRRQFTTNEELQTAILKIPVLHNYCLWIHPDYGPICAWDVSRMTDLSEVFSLLDDFNQPLNRWNVSNVTNMNGIFCWAKNFNQPLDKWNVSNVETMQQMFELAKSFNQPLETWDVSNVTNMSHMFDKAQSYNQVFKGWNLASLQVYTSFASNSSITHDAVERFVDAAKRKGIVVA